MRIKTNQIVKYITQNPFCTRQIIAVYFGLSRQDIAYHIKKIKDAKVGLIVNLKPTGRRPLETYRIMNKRKIKNELK